MGSLTSKSSSNDQQQGCYHQVIVYQIPCLCVLVHMRAPCVSPCVSAKISTRVSRSANLSCRLMEASRADGELPSALSAASVFAAAHLSRPTDKVICLWLSCQSLSQNGGAAINKKSKRETEAGAEIQAHVHEQITIMTASPCWRRLDVDSAAILSPLFFHFTCNLKQMALASLQSFQ